MVCLDIIKDKWSPVNTVSMILTSIQVGFVYIDIAYSAEFIEWSKSEQSRELRGCYSKGGWDAWCLVVP